MKKAIAGLLFLMFVSAIVLSEIDDYYGSWIFFLLGTTMVAVGYLFKGVKYATLCFWIGVLIMAVTFTAANISSDIYRKAAMAEQG